MFIHNVMFIYGKVKIDLLYIIDFSKSTLLIYSIYLNRFLLISVDIDADKS